MNIKPKLFKNRYLIILCSNDEFELPIQVFDNVQEMSDYFKDSYKKVYFIVRRAFVGRNIKSYKYGKIEFVEADESKEELLYG